MQLPVFSLTGPTSRLLSAHIAHTMGPGIWHMAHVDFGWDYSPQLMVYGCAKRRGREKQVCRNSKRGEHLLHFFWVMLTLSSFTKDIKKALLVSKEAEQEEKA